MRSHRYVHKLMLIAIVPLLFPLTSLFGSSPSALAASDYSVADLGTLGGNLSEGWDINDAGQVVGWAESPSGVPYHGFLWQNGVMTDLGTLGSTNSYAHGINDVAQVVGDTDLSGYGRHAFLWQNGVMTDLGGLGGGNSRAFAINNVGQVVGEGNSLSGNGQAFLWRNGVITNLGALGGSENSRAGSSAYGINDTGQVVGESYLPNGTYHAFLWQNGIMTDLGTLGGGSSSARGINNEGQVVGEAGLPDGTYHAFLWQNGVMTDLGTLGGANSEAFGINDAGQVVGMSYLPNGTYHAFLWQNGVMKDLGTFGGRNSMAWAINNAGQITGKADLTTGNYHAFLLTPTQTTHTAIAYYALGDSIASGHGLMDNFPDPCHRSQDSSYPALVRTKLLGDFQNVDFSLLACSGASFNHTTEDTKECQSQTPSHYQENCNLQQVNNQFSALRAALSRQQPGTPTLVSITVGIDDLDWTDPNTVFDLIGKPDSNFFSYMDKLTQASADNLTNQVHSLLTDYPEVKVIISGYYNPFNQQSWILQWASLWQGISPQFSKLIKLLATNVPTNTTAHHNLNIITGWFMMLNRGTGVSLPREGLCVDFRGRTLNCYERTQQAILLFNASLVSVVSHEAGVFPGRIAFASVDKAFQGHESPQPLCGGAPPSVSETWIQYPSEKDVNSPIPEAEQPLLYPARYGDCFHPNYDGAKAYADIVFGEAQKLGY